MIELLINGLIDFTWVEYLIYTLVVTQITIMNQKIVTGIGNIYASESLFLAKIQPNKKSNRLNQQNYIDLVSAVKKVLSIAIRKGGTTIKDFKTIDGKPDENTQVYHLLF